ncbi:MAG: cadherin domain-containing protein [Pseudomonadota bacterium]
MKYPLSLLAATLALAACDNNDGPSDRAPTFAVDSATASIAENAMGVVYQANATDPERQSVTYAITTNDDGALFSVAADGSISLQAPLDFETPIDSDNDGVYIVNVVATDGLLTSSPLAVAVTVTDVPFSIANLQVMAGNDPRTVVLGWDADEQTSDFAEYVVTASPDGIVSPTDRQVGITSSSATLELPLVSTDFTNTTFTVEARDASGNLLAFSPSIALDNGVASEALTGYIKASVAEDGDDFGGAVALSPDGSTMAIGAIGEDSASPTDPTDNSLSSTGAVTVYAKTGTAWQVEGYIKAPNAEDSDFFGHAVALSEDGSTLLVGAPLEDGNALRVDGDGTDNSRSDSGAAYVYRRSNGTWALDAYLKPPFGVTGFWFGRALAMSADGDTLFVGAMYQENSLEVSVPTTNTPPADRRAAAPPNRRTAVFVYRFDNGAWTYDDQFSVRNPTESRSIYDNLSASADGNRVVIGGPADDSDATTIDGDATNANRPDSGAAYVFDFDAQDGWDVAAYLKAPNAGANDLFGYDVDISADGRFVLVGAPNEDSVIGMPSDDSLPDSGAAYLFEESATGWTFVEMVKPASVQGQDGWGRAVAINGVGTLLAVASPFETTSATGVLSDGSNIDTAFESGAVAVFRSNAGTWSEGRLLKANNTDEDDGFGFAVAISDDGETVLVGAPNEDGTATGINGQDNDDGDDSGAAYLF